jgi:hypothetical protein
MLNAQTDYWNVKIFCSTAYHACTFIIIYSSKIIFKSVSS